MSRRKSNYKREVIPDPVYNDVVVAKFVNKMTYGGKNLLLRAFCIKRWIL